jgi:hypothetical protein
MYTYTHTHIHKYMIEPHNDGVCLISQLSKGAEATKQLINEATKCKD